MGTNIKVVQPSGILDGVTSVNLRRDIDDLLAAGADTVLIDFKDVTFMNSSGLGALVAILKNVRSQNANLFICALSDQVKIIFSLTKMERIFKIFANREEFEQKVGNIS